MLPRRIREGRVRVVRERGRERQGQRQRGRERGYKRVITGYKSNHSEIPRENIDTIIQSASDRPRMGGPLCRWFDR